MKKFHYNSLTAFYRAAETRTNISDKAQFEYYRDREDNADFTGLPRADILKYKFGYPLGVEKLRHLTDFKVEKETKVKYYDSFDGYDIDIDRMQEGLDFLNNEKKIRKLPKTMDIFINVAEGARISYESMLNKAYAALKIIDHLETLGVRTALFSCISGIPLYANNRRGSPLYVEVAVKNYADSVNLGALCTAISPWFFRHWGFLFMTGHYKKLAPGLGYSAKLPFEALPKNAITIDTGQCHTRNRANNFISNLKLVA